MKIIYKIVNTLLVLTLIPILLFLPMFQFIMTVGMSSENQILSLLGSFLDVEEIISSVTGIDISSLPENYTLLEAYNMFFGDEAQISAEGFDTSVLPDSLVKYFSAAGILIVIALALAAIVMILGLFLKRKKGIMVVGSALSFGCAYAGGKCFTHIASQLVSGKISLVEIIAGIPAFSEYSSYISYIDIDVRLFKLSTAFSLTLVVLGAMFLLNLGFLIADQVSN
ncbi:MAG: hypothetical protein LUG85_02940 [Clostridiales bacterium]|nr:hypothetical protein [Clostridiales bacterium]